ncbi:MAG: GNAT family N-acetyltransferase [Eubacteriaceae bacterium]|nr:GNAT family N-acetyltransferase [Eubacteriaceae bacterium]
MDKQKPKVSFRQAGRKDCQLTLGFITKLAIYEKLESEVTATPQLLEEWLFDKNAAEVIFGMVDGIEVAFALYFTNFSTFLGKSGLYLEDLYVLEEHRSKGVGTAMLKKLASIAVERGYGRFEWSCLDWNKPSIDFYLALGAIPMEGWTVYRLTGKSLQSMASGSRNYVGRN